MNSDKFAAAGTEVLLVYPGPPADLDQRAKEVLVKENPLPANVHLVIDPDYVIYESLWAALGRAARDCLSFNLFDRRSGHGFL